MRKILYWLASLFGLVLLFLLFPARTPAEVSLEPRSIRTVLAPERQGEAILGMRTEDYVVYVAESGAIVHAEPISFGAAVSDAAYINFDQVPASLILRSPQGRILAGVPTSSYPFYLEEALYSVGPDRRSIQHWDVDGNLIWHQQFAELVTAVDGNGERILLGFLSGRILLLGPGGDIVHQDVVADSEPVYGVALSAEGSSFASLSGIVPQVLHVFEIRSSGVRERQRIDLESSFRSRVDLRFSPDGSRVVWSNARQILELSAGNNVLQSRAPGGEVLGVEFTPRGDELIVLSGDSTSLAVSIFAGDQVWARLGYSGQSGSVRFHHGKVFLGRGEELITLEGVER